jgi:hypothetical protein
MVHGRNIQLKKEFKNAERTFLRFNSRIDMATIRSVVIRSFVIISPNPHFRALRKILCKFESNLDKNAVNFLIYNVNQRNGFASDCLFSLKLPRYVREA